MAGRNDVSGRKPLFSGDVDLWTPLAALAAMLALTQCAPASTVADTAAKPLGEAGAGSVAPASGASTAEVVPPPATGFITANPEPPPGARVDDKGIARDAAGRPYGYALLGQPFPELDLPLHGGGRFTTADLIGKWTVIDIWGVWCPDCVADGPYVAALATAIAQDPDLGFISIHTPPSPARAADAFGKFGSLDAYFTAKGFSYLTAIDADGATLEPLKVTWRPSYLVVGPDGTVRGYRSDFSAAEGEPVKDFVRAVAELKRQG